MKKIFSSVLVMLLFAQYCMASELYFVQNVIKNDILNIIETSFVKNKYSIQKFNPYLAVSQKNPNEKVIIIVQDDTNGLYYYYDGNTKLNSNILSSLRKKKYVYSMVNTKLKDSFDNIAKESILGQKITYDFETNSINNIEIQNTAQDNNYARSNYNSFSNNQNNNTFYGYIGQVASGTELSAYLKDSLNTENAKKGDNVVLVLSKDLVYNGSIVAPQGSLINGVITQANSSGYARKNGKISIDFNRLTLPSGSVYNIKTEKVDFKVDNDEGKGEIVSNVVTGVVTSTLIALLYAGLSKSSHVGRAAAIGAGIGAAGGAINYAAKKGYDAEIPAYTEINLVLTEPLGIQVK